MGGQLEKGDAMYSSVTSDIHVIVTPQFLSSQSSVEENFYLYAYTIRIENRSKETVQLLRRQWMIRNGKGQEEKVEGEGVIGKKPIIPPGKYFEYSSGCPLTTATGNMRGSYLMKTDRNKLIEVKVPLFFLRPPLPNSHAS